MIGGVTSLMLTMRDESLKYCAGFTALIALALLYAGLWSLDAGLRPAPALVSSMSTSLWVACGFFAVGVMASQALKTRSLPAASWSLCLCAAAGIFALLTSVLGPYRVIAFLLPALFAAFLLDSKGFALFTGLVLAASLALDRVYFAEDLGQWQVFLPLLALLAVAIFTWLLANLLFSTIDWYAERYKSAHLNEQIIRENESKLERLVKSLNDYEKYLKITNELLIEARDEAEKARNVKQIFVQNVSHELRTPLNLIIGFSETMINTPGTYGEVNWTPELKGDIECIYQNSQHLKALIDDVLDLAAMENKKYEIQVADVDLNAIIREVALISQVSFRAKDLYLETSLYEETLMVRADTVRTRQVLLNLLSNALKFTVTGGVVISARRDGSFARVDVRDTGKGIPPEALEKVFDAFYQVDKYSHREATGTGLGLSISRQLVELHGGEMQISSTVALGTTVSFTLPLAE